MNYDVIRIIGSGSYGKVYLVRKKGTYIEYALKRIHLHRLKDTEKQYLLNELNIIRYSKSPFLLKYIDCSYNKYFINIITPIYKNGDLHDLITKTRKNKQYFKEYMIWNYLIQLLLGIHYLHKHNIIHRDIKPSNIFLGNDISTLIIGDFGISKILYNENFTRTVVGTPYYMSPEILKKCQYGKKVDVWAIGCILVELITMRPPFQGKTLNELKENILSLQFYKNINEYEYSNELTTIVKSMLLLNPKHRPSITELLKNPSIYKKRNILYGYKIDDLDITHFDHKFKKKHNIRVAIDHIKQSSKHSILPKIPRPPWNYNTPRHTRNYNHKRTYNIITNQPNHYKHILPPI